MKTFLIQKIGGRVVHDFAFQLMDAVHYHNWYNNQETYKIILSEEVTNDIAIPVGSLEFVFSYMEKNLNIKKEQIKPINIPTELLKNKYTKRKCEIAHKEEIIFREPLFIKSATQYKMFTDVTDKKDVLPEDLYLVSEKIEIDSEWRSFVNNRELVGLHHYAGDFTQFPDVNLLKEMINNYKNCPPSYTLDVGINQNGTFIIEVHPFVSCGLYGFRDNRILPHMFINAYEYMVKEAKKGA